MSERPSCFRCGRVIEGHPSMGMNLPGVTPGPIHFCYECEPPKSAEEIIESIESFLDPPKEKAS